MTTLREALALCEPRNPAQANIYDRDLARELLPVCEARGYGAVLQAVAALWYRKDPDGCHTIGPAALTVRDALNEHGPDRLESSTMEVSHEQAMGIWAILTGERLSNKPSTWILTLHRAPRSRG